MRYGKVTDFMSYSALHFLYRYMIICTLLDSFIAYGISDRDKKTNGFSWHFMMSRIGFGDPVFFYDG